ncbi:MAG: hypothetical protein KDA35_08530, partial [Hyphomonadaceae bacterium]|nr:hypothetical protein [Hyphomonadaceae bacterium]
INAISQRRSRGSDNHLYCYAVWLRHLCLAHKNGLCTAPPEHVAELGPGDSLGVGIAALISGAESYRAFDVVAYANTDRNLAVFDGLVDLFARRADIPGAEAFPRMKPLLENYAFPHEVLTAAHMERNMAPARIARLRRAVETGDASVIGYTAPWRGQSLGGAEIDMIISQAVLEYVDDIAGVHAELSHWLKPSGFVSHEIDFKCHGFANEWDGHWRYSNAVWKFMKGRRLYTINREPYSVHERALTTAGMQIVGAQFHPQPSNLQRTDLTSSLAHLTEQDLTIASACIQARKF